MSLHCFPSAQLHTIFNTLLFSGCCSCLWWSVQEQITLGSCHSPSPWWRNMHRSHLLQPLAPKKPWWELTSSYVWHERNITGSIKPQEVWQPKFLCSQNLGFFFLLLFFFLFLPCLMSVKSVCFLTLFRPWARNISKVLSLEVTDCFLFCLP